MLLPDWFVLDAAAVSKRSRLMSHQIEGDADATAATADVAALIQVFAPTVLMRLRRAARPLSFPCTPTQMQTARPDDDAQTLADEIEYQKSNAISVVEQIVIAMLYKPMATEEYQAVARGFLDGRGSHVSGKSRLASAEAILVSLEENLEETVWLHSLNDQAAIAKAARLARPIGY